MYYLTMIQTSVILTLILLHSLSRNTIDLNNINLDDDNFDEGDPTSIVLLILMTWCNKQTQRKACNKQDGEIGVCQKIKKKTKKKTEIKPFLIDDKWYNMKKIVSIDTNQQLCNLSSKLFGWYVKERFRDSLAQKIIHEKLV